MKRISNKFNTQNPPENFSGLEQKTVGFLVINSMPSRNRKTTLKGKKKSGGFFFFPLWWAAWRCD
jgi:hypothetical protein